MESVAGAKRLRKTMMDHAGKQLSVQEMVGVYFEVMDASAHAAALGELSGKDAAREADIRDIEGAVSEFNRTLHRRMLEQLEESIGSLTESLRCSAKLHKSKEEAKAEEESYGQLRAMMSTREFALQYDAGLSHD